MSTSRTQTFEDERREPGEATGGAVLVLLWSLEEPHRVGEVLPLPRGRARFGRAAPDPLAPMPILGLERRRPGRVDPTGGLGSTHISRVQWELEERGDGSVVVVNRGRARLRVDGRVVGEGLARPGELVEIADLALFRLSTRAPLPNPHTPSLPHPFGLADADGIVGESPATWEIRERVAFVAARDVHALILGPSGTGKELVARAIHRRSSRSRGPFVARNAATIPDTLIDAELFGNARNYPNAGMAERPGLIGEADGGTLFLDEVGDLPQALQTHLLRVLDAGEYTRLGEARPRRADIRLVGATNRPPDSLRHDVRARMPLVVELPALGERLDDVPLLARHVVRRIHSTDPTAVSRFCDAEGSPRLSRGLVERLVGHAWQGNMRELDALLWDAIARSPGSVLDLADTSRPAPVAAPITRAPTLDPAEVQAALDRHHGNQEETWRELGLPSRHVLGRFVRKHHLRVRGRS